MAGELEFDLESPDLKAVLEAVKQFSPALSRELRRELRQSGDEIIAAQKSELDKPLPGNVRTTGTRVVLIRPKNGRRPYYAVRNIYEDVATERGGHTGMRDAIKDSLSTRVSTSKTRQGINIRTNRARAPMAIVWQSSRFRHPVFNEHGVAPYVEQKGQPYFWSPITQRMVHVRQRVADAIDNALHQITQ